MPSSEFIFILSVKCYPTLTHLYLVSKNHQDSLDQINLRQRNVERTLAQQEEKMEVILRELSDTRKLVEELTGRGKGQRDKSGTRL